MQNSTVAKIALTAAVAVAGVGFFVYQALGHSEHYKMVGALMAGDLKQWKDSEIQVHGWVLAGSIREQVVNQDVQRTFVLTESGKKIRVFNHGPKPDTFKDQAEVVATGRLVPASEFRALAGSLGVTLEADLDYVLDAEKMSAKCPSKYEGARAAKFE